MSYSFQVRAAAKAEAIALVGAELAKVVAAQPVHVKDEPLAQSAAAGFINLLADVADQDVVVTVSGSVWNASDGIRQANCNVTVGLANKEKAAAEKA